MCWEEEKKKRVSVARPICRNDRLSMGFHPRPSTGPFAELLPPLACFLFQSVFLYIHFRFFHGSSSFYPFSSSAFSSSIIITIVIICILNSLSDWLVGWLASPACCTGAHANIYLKPLNLHLWEADSPPGRESSPRLKKKHGSARDWHPFFFLSHRCNHWPTLRLSRSYSVMAINTEKEKEKKTKKCCFFFWTCGFTWFMSNSFPLPSIRLPNRLHKYSRDDLPSKSVAQLKRKKFLTLFFRRTMQSRFIASSAFSYM